MWRYLILSVLLCCNCNFLYSQHITNKIDSLYNNTVTLFDNVNLEQALQSAMETTRILDSIGVKINPIYSNSYVYLAYCELLVNDDFDLFTFYTDIAVEHEFKTNGMTPLYYELIANKADGILIHGQNRNDIKSALRSAIKLYQKLPNYNSIDEYHQLQLSLNIQEQYDSIQNEYRNQNYNTSYGLSISLKQLMDSLSATENPMYSDCLHYIGVSALMSNRDFDMFSTNIQNAIDLEYKLEGINNNFYWFKQCYADGCIAYSKLIQFPENLNLLKKAYSIYGELPPKNRQHQNYLSLLNDLSVRYKDVDIDISIQLAKELLNIQQEIVSPDTILTLSNLSYYYSRKGKFREALEYGNTVMRYRENNEADEDGLRIIYQRMAGIYNGISNYSKAIEYSNKSGAIALKLYGEDSDEYCRYLQNTGVYHCNNGNIPEAISLTKKAYNSINGNKLDNSRNLANLFQLQGDTDSTSCYINKCWTHIKDSIESNIINLDCEDRFLYSLNPISYSNLNYPIIALLEYGDNPVNRNLSYECLMVFKNIQTESNLYNHLNAISKISVDSIKNSLSPNDVAIEFWSDKSGVYTDSILGFILRKNWEYPKLVRLSKNDIYQIIRGEKPTTETYLPLYEYIWKEIEEQSEIKMGDTIYVSLDDILTQIPIEFICGYDWEYIGDKYNVIRVSSTKNITKIKERRLIAEVQLYGGLDYESVDNEYGFNHADNIIGIISDNAKSKFRSSLTYLPWSKIEVDSIESIIRHYQPQIITYKTIGEFGSETKLKSQVFSAPSILHLATHGYYLFPEDCVDVSIKDVLSYHQFCMNHSGLLMAGCYKNFDKNSEKFVIQDGFLNSTEIASLNLRNIDLLILSACNTGLGSFNTPYGVQGLPSAFKSAGVSTILMTLSEVDDAATYLFMTTFYKALMANGHTYREAFKIAQQKLRNSEEFRDFNYWANFVMID